MINNDPLQHKQGKDKILKLKKLILIGLCM